MRDASLAKNEEIFRNVNERIERVSQEVARDDAMMEYLCECDRADCYEKINATRQEYEDVRAESTRFIVLAGHEDRRVERVAFATDRFLVVEKQGQAARDAEETDPESGAVAAPPEPDSGRIIAAGRASEIIDLGGGRVFRRFKQDGDPAGEAELMAHALRSGYPVPRVDEVKPDGLVLEYVSGPTMAEDARRRPWRFAAHARTLARLHERLHRIPMSNGRVLLHLDLHWKNVLMSPRGPVVIDWANAAAGEAAVDPALTWVILMTSAGPSGRMFARLFSRHIDVRSALPGAVSLRLADRNVTASERARVEQFLA